MIKSIGRFVYEFKWSRDGLWTITKNVTKHHLYFALKKVTRGNETLFQCIIWKFSFAFGWAKNDD